MVRLSPSEVIGETNRPKAMATPSSTGKSWPSAYSANAPVAPRLSTIKGRLRSRRRSAIRAATGLEISRAHGPTASNTPISPGPSPRSASQSGK